MLVYVVGMETVKKVHIVETDAFIVITAAEGWTEDEWESAVGDEVLRTPLGDWDYVVEREEDGTFTDVWIMGKDQS